MDVRESARRTLEAGSARVSHGVFFDPPPTHTLIALMEHHAEGVADFTVRRARLEQSLAPEWDALAERIARKYPWLDDGEDEDECEDQFATVFAGGCRYIGTGDGWTAAEGCDPLGPRTDENPTWILDALAGARGARTAGSEQVRETACERYTLEPVDLQAAADVADGAIALPPHGGLKRPTLRGDVWVDGDGLLRRVTWMLPLRVRRRARPREEPPRLWRTTELWDFGLPVDIPVPEAQPPPDDGPLLRGMWEAGTSLWRMRADYRRRHPEGR